METIEQFIQSELQQRMEQVFGTSYRIASMDKFQGGAQKVVFHIKCTNGFTCMLYIWDVNLNYFAEEKRQEHADGRARDSQLFMRNHTFLKELGIRIPDLYAFFAGDDASHPFDYALIQYVTGTNAEHYFSSDESVRSKVLGRLDDMLATMHGADRPTFGKLGEANAEQAEYHDLITSNAKEQLGYVVQHMTAVAKKQAAIWDGLDELLARIKPRRSYGFIHGELGPDHVLVNERQEPYLIDIEGAEFGDVEHEHSFLQFRFGDFYRYLQQDNLDADRMLLYRLNHHISCASGGLKLLHRGFPNQKLAQGIADYNARSIMQCVDAMRA